MINIYYCADNKMFKQLLMSVLSLAKTNPLPVNVVNLTVEIPEFNAKGRKTSEAQTALLDSILKKSNPNSSFTTVDVSDLFRDKLLKGPNLHNKYYSYYVTVRLLAHLVDEIPDKVIYMDTDCIVKDDLTDFFNIDMQNYEIAGRRDKFRISRYFQSGVMLMNMKKIRETGLLERACKLCATKKYICYIDMSALNTATKKRKMLSAKYNSFKNDDCYVFHVCDLREGKFPLTKKWAHRIKPDETEAFFTRCPDLAYLKESYEQVQREHPEVFKI